MLWGARLYKAKKVEAGKRREESVREVVVGG
jgi:hypothetical protein